MKILLAVDDDAASYEAALAVSEWFPDDTEVVALHVGTTTPAPHLVAPPVGPSGATFTVYPMLDLRHRGDEIHREAKEVAARAAELTDGTVRTEAGDPASQIVEVADDVDADLIVVGTGDRSWLSRLLDPSVSNTVVSKADRSVLVIRRS